jgi:hypothetical protein
MKNRVGFNASSFASGSGEFRQLEFYEISSDRRLLLVNEGSSIVTALSDSEGNFRLRKAQLLESIGSLFLDFESNPDLHRVMVTLEELEIEDLDAALVWLFSGSFASYRFRPACRRSVGKHYSTINGRPKAAVVTVRRVGSVDQDQLSPEPRVVMNGRRIKGSTAEFTEAIAMARLGILEAEEEAGWRGHVLERILGVWADGIDPDAARIAAGKATRSLIANEQEGIG